MSVTIHRVTKYTVQVLTKKAGEDADGTLVVRLYDDDDLIRGTAVFNDYGSKPAPKPTGDHDSQTATINLALEYYAPFVDILRTEKSIYLKMAWAQLGANKVLSHVSVDTKKEIIGEYFTHSSEP